VWNLDDLGFVTNLSKQYYIVVNTVHVYILVPPRVVATHVLNLVYIKI
jgi:hypothetical protein